MLKGILYVTLTYTFMVCQPVVTSNATIKENKENEQQKEFAPLIQPSEKRSLRYDKHLQVDEDLFEEHPRLPHISRACNLISRKKGLKHGFLHSRPVSKKSEHINVIKKGHSHSREAMHNKPFHNYNFSGLNSRSSIPRLSAISKYHESNKRTFPGRSLLSDPFFHERFLKESYRNTNGKWKEDAMAPDRGLRGRYLKLLSLEGLSQRHKNTIPGVPNAIIPVCNNSMVKEFDMNSRMVPALNNDCIQMGTEMNISPHASEQGSDKFNQFYPGQFPTSLPFISYKKEVPRLEVAYGRDLTKPINLGYTNLQSYPMLTESFNLKDNLSLVKGFTDGVPCPIYAPLKLEDKGKIKMSFPFHAKTEKKQKHKPSYFSELNVGDLVCEPEKACSETVGPPTEDLTNKFVTNLPSISTYDFHEELIKNINSCTSTQQSTLDLQCDLRTQKTPENGLFSKVITLSKHIQGPLPKVNIKVMVNNKVISSERVCRSSSAEGEGKANLKSRISSVGTIKSKTIAIEKIPSYLQLKISVNNQTSKPVSIPVSK